METLKSLLSYPLSIVFYLLFGLTLCIFHPLQWLGKVLGGSRGHRRVVDIMNLCILRCLHVLGVTFSFKNNYNLPKNQPLIIVSNHQSMFDIPLISWFLRRCKPKFISKIELGKGIPSISFNLRHGGHVLIDRKNPRQSIPALSKFGKFIVQNNFSGVIFPEGTRSKNGVPKEFAPTGLKILFKNAENALIVPVAINNGWKLVRFGNFPMGIGIHLSLEVLEPILIDKEPDILIEKIQERITLAVRT
ncbi:lysophospholipid acyltransferase family protein [Aquimarina pacifica]|uniref:lysophospholipid acyltransferase family protein n=1 Tax=Aquimarina pacifica TaxID=1296415 RepID=UPI00047141D8|nr:lysophospholipid acyltransferase family protein [Aquimarina pacifica]